MKKQIVHISVHQTSKVVAAMHAIPITLVFILPTVLGYWFHQQVMMGLFLLILLPLFLWFFIYLGYVIACWFYNLMVPWLGGVEVEMREIEVQPQLIKKAQVETSPVPLEETSIFPDQKN